MFYSLQLNIMVTNPWLPSFRVITVFSYKQNKTKIHKNPKQQNIIALHMLKGGHRASHLLHPSLCFENLNKIILSKVYYNNLFSPKISIPIKFKIRFQPTD